MKAFIIFILCVVSGYANIDWQAAENALEHHQYNKALALYEKVIVQLSQTTPCDKVKFIDSAHKASILSAKLGDKDKSRIYADLIGTATSDWFGKPYRIRTRQSRNGIIETPPCVRQISFTPWNSYWGVIFICNKCGTIYNSNPGTCERVDCDSTSFTAKDVFPD